MRKVPRAPTVHKFGGASLADGKALAYALSLANRPVEIEPSLADVERALRKGAS